MNKVKSEHEEQVELFRWLAEVAYAGFALVQMKAVKPYNKADPLFKPIPELKFAHAVPNGGARGNDSRTNQIRGSMLKAEGVRAGVPDIFIPVPLNGKHGLYIEMKVADRKKGRVSEDQKTFIAFAESVGYHCEVCYGAEEAKQAVMRYFNYSEGIL